MNRFESFIERDDVSTIAALIGLFIVGYITMGAWLQ